MTFFFQFLLSFFRARVCLCVAVHLLGLTWHLRHGESQLYENGLSSADHQQEEHGKSRPTSSVHLLDTLNPENTHAGDKGTRPYSHSVLCISVHLNTPRETDQNNHLAPPAARVL